MSDSEIIDIQYINKTNINKYRRIRQHTMEMLQDRGYNIANIITTDKSFKEQFFDKELRELNISCLNSRNESIYVTFFGSNGRKSSIDELVKSLSDQNYDGVIIILKDAPNAVVSNRVAEINHNRVIALEIFIEEELLVNVTHHAFVPRHILMTEEQKQAVLDKYQATGAQFPKICVTDPVARYYHAAINQMFHIIRIYDEGEEYHHYRIVV